MRLLHPLFVLVLSSFVSVYAGVDTLWPQPSTVTYNVDGPPVYLDASFRILMSARSTTPLLNSAFARYSTYIFEFNTPSGTRRPALMGLTVNCLNPLNESLGLNNDESYTLNVTVDFAILTANEVWGVLRGLETFYQLTEYDPETKSYSISSLPIAISDAPRFPWRGLLLDTARHFIPVPSILRTIDAMSFNKMNTLHWHITDSQSFPLQVPELLALSELGAWDQSAVYTPQNIDEIVRYAHLRGIRVVPEIDVPSHAKAWGLAFPGITMDACQEEKAPIVERGRLTYCTGVKDMIPFNPTNDQLYTVLQKVFSYVSSKFPELYLHLGGDEVKYKCWDTPEINEWMSDHNITSPRDLQQYFTDRLGSFLVGQLNRKDFVVWYEFFGQSLAIPGVQDLIVHTWMDAQHTRLSIQAGYRTITSVGWYLDRQVPDQPANYQWVDTWTNFWRNDPLRTLLTGDTHHHLLGGEAAMWAEHVDAVNLDSRVWPRACGVAERLWSPALPKGAETVLIDDARVRLAEFRCRLARRGVGAGPVMPDYCLLPTGLYQCNASKEVIVTNCTRPICPECPACTTPSSSTTPSPTTPKPTTPKPTTPRPTSNNTCKDECALCDPTAEQCSGICDVCNSTPHDKPLVTVTWAFVATFIAGLLTGAAMLLVAQVFASSGDSGVHSATTNGHSRSRGSRQYSRI